MGILIKFPREKQAAEGKDKSCISLEKAHFVQNSLAKSDGAQLLFFTGVRYERVGGIRDKRNLSKR